MVGRRIGGLFLRKLVTIAKDMYVLYFCVKCFCDLFRSGVGMIVYHRIPLIPHVPTNQPRLDNELPHPSPGGTSAVCAGKILGLYSLPMLV